MYTDHGPTFRHFAGLNKIPPTRSRGIRTDVYSNSLTVELASGNLVRTLAYVFNLQIIDKAVGVLFFLKPLD